MNYQISAASCKSDLHSPSQSSDIAQLEPVKTKLFNLITG